jgi:hypothetical protein
MTISYIIRGSYMYCICSSVQTMQTGLTARSYVWDCPNHKTEQKVHLDWFVYIIFMDVNFFMCYWPQFTTLNVLYSR